MKNKSYAVIGLGQFGMTVALTLADAGCDVLAIDDREENVQDIAEKVSYAVKADVKEPGILQSVGVQNVDVAVIAVAENMEASIIAAMQVKTELLDAKRKREIFELENIKLEKAEESQKRSREKNRGPKKTQKKARNKRKVKAR